MRKFHLGTLSSEQKGSATVRDGIAFYRFFLVWPELLSVDDIVRSPVSSCLFLVVLFLVCPESGGFRLLQSGWYSTFN